MRFDKDARQLSLTLTFDSAEQVEGSAIDALVVEGERRKFWEVRAIVPVQSRNLDCFDEFYEEANDGAMVTLRKSVSLRPKIRGD